MLTKSKSKLGNHKINRLKLAIAVVILSFYSFVSSAGPDKTTSLLMDTPASVFDIGMIRFNMGLDDIKLSVGPIYREAIYDWDRDKIKVSFSVHNYKGDLASGRKVCIDLFGELRDHAGVDPNTVKLFWGGRVSSYWSEYFSLGYQGAGSKKKPTELDKKFLLNCHVNFRDRSKGFIMLRSSLLSASVSE